jgi:hypothetical protein
MMYATSPTPPSGIETMTSASRPTVSPTANSLPACVSLKMKSRIA